MAFKLCAILLGGMRRMIDKAASMGSRFGGSAASSPWETISAILPTNAPPRALAAATGVLAGSGGIAQLGKRCSTQLQEPWCSLRWQKLQCKCVKLLRTGRAPRGCCSRLFCCALVCYQTLVDISG